MNEFAGMVFAIVQAVNMTTGVRLVQIIATPNQTNCETVLPAATAALSRSGDVEVERAECVARLPADYRLAITGEPVPDALSVSYEISLFGRAWSATQLFYNVGEAYQSSEGCKAITAYYQAYYHHSDGEVVTCVNGYD